MHPTTAHCCSAPSAATGEYRPTPARSATRRGVLVAGAGLTAAGAALSGTSAAAAFGGARQSTPSRRGTSIVLLGTQGGPPANPKRAGISTALVVDGAAYLIDAGRMSVSQYAIAGLKWADLRSVFVTHLHADHIAELFQVFLLGGFQPPMQGDSLAGPTAVYGPGAAGGLPPTFGGGESPTTNPSDPTPGLAGFFDYASSAFAYSTNVFMRDSRIRETRGLADVHEISLPVEASYQQTAPTMEPFVVMEDDRVRVSAVLVPHGPVFPAFAYRFDTDQGSVTLSGDTTYHDNLIRLAKNSDVLVHEAINVQGWNGPPAVVNHLLEGHVEVQKVGPIAQSADVERMVLSHIGDLTQPDLNEQKWRRWASRGYDGKVLVGSDLDVVRVG